MRKSVWIILMLLVGFQSTTHAADQWSKSLAGTTQAADIDSNVSTSWSAQDRMLSNYRQGAAVIRNSASTLTVLTGELALPDSSVSTVRYRKNTANVSVSWSDIDTGVEASATQYYVYGLADSDATTFTVKISASSSAPSGSTYYRKLGEFYNDASGNITNVISYRSDNGADNRDMVKGWVNFTGTGTVTINDSYNVSSITDNGTGDYTVNWTTAFATANYAVAGSCQISGSDGAASKVVVIAAGTSPTTSSVRIKTIDVSSDAGDSVIVTLIATGDRV